MRSQICCPLRQSLLLQRVGSRVQRCTLHLPLVSERSGQSSSSSSSSSSSLMVPQICCHLPQPQSLQLLGKWLQPPFSSRAALAELSQICRCK